MKNNRMTSSILTSLKRNRTKTGNFSLRKLPASLAAVICLLSTPVFAQEPNLNEANLTFVGADIESVIKAIGHYTGTTFIVDPRVKGTINLVTEEPVTKAQAFSLLTSTLRLQGYAVVTANGFTKVLPESDGKLQAGPTQVSGIKGDQIATQIYRLNYESATNLVNVLRPLISPNNTISINQGNNSVVITDYADNLKRMEKIIATLDTPGNSDVDVIPMKHAIASDVATMLLRMTEQSFNPADSGKINILADSRTNAILLHAPSEARANLLKSLIAKLDQPTALPGNVHVVYLRNANSTKLAETLRAIISTESSSTGSTSSSGSGSGPSQSMSRPASMGFGGGGPSGSGFGGSGSGFGGSGGGLGSGSSMGGSSSGSSSNTQPTLPTGGPAGFIQADAATNTLIITASETVYRNLRAVIDQLDARRAQVYIEALIIDVTTTDLDQFGVQWAGITGNSNTRVRVGGSTSFNTANIGEANFNLFNLAATKAAGKGVFPSAGLNVGLFSTNLGLGAIASALQSKGIANVLSVPTLTTLDNEEANVLVGQNVSFVNGSYATPSAGGGVSPFNTTERKDVGIILKVRPQVSEGGSVKLDIVQEVSSIAAGSTATDPIINKRLLDTKVIVDDGEIVILGGLMNDNVDGFDDQVPILGDIPIIGNLFKYKKKTRVKRNLLVFIRPTVLRNQDQSTSVTANRYDYMRAIVKTDKPNEPLLDLPSLLPEQGSKLIPQTLLNREVTATKLDSQLDSHHAVNQESLLMEQSGQTTLQTPVSLSPAETVH